MMITRKLIPRRTSDLHATCLLLKFRRRSMKKMITMKRVNFRNCSIRLCISLIALRVSAIRPMVLDRALGLRCMGISLWHLGTADRWRSPGILMFRSQNKEWWQLHEHLDSMQWRVSANPQFPNSIPSESTWIRPTLEIPMQICSEQACTNRFLENTSLWRMREALTMPIKELELLNICPVVVVAMDRVAMAPTPRRTKLRVSREWARSRTNKWSSTTSPNGSRTDSQWEETQANSPPKHHSQCTQTSNQQPPDTTQETTSSTCSNKNKTCQTQPKPQTWTELPTPPTWASGCSKFPSLAQTFLRTERTYM